MDMYYYYYKTITCRCGNERQQKDTRTEHHVDHCTALPLCWEEKYEIKL